MRQQQAAQTSTEFRQVLNNLHTLLCTDQCIHEAGWPRLAQSGSNRSQLLLWSKSVGLLAERASTHLTELKRLWHNIGPNSLCATNKTVCLYALCIQKMTPTACALLEFTEAPLRILMVSDVVGIGIPTSTSPALDIAALCLSSWPAAIFTQTVPASLLSASSLL